MFIAIPHMFHIRGSKSYPPDSFISSLEFYSDFKAMHLKPHQNQLVIESDVFSVVVLSTLTHESV